MELIQIDKPGEYKIVLDKPGMEVRVVGAFQTHGRESVVVNLVLIHQAPHTRGRVTLKGVAFDQSHLKLQGKVIVAENSPDTQSFLEERVLLLSEQAKAETIPELEILTDDVKCSHAASISRIPAEQLFYLQSRGLSLAQASELIVAGFLATK